MKYDRNGVYDYGNKNDLLFRQFRDAINQFEDTQRVQRSKHGKLRRAKEGRWIGGPAPYGNKNDIIRKLLEIDNDQATSVQKKLSMVYGRNVPRGYSVRVAQAGGRFELNFVGNLYQI